MAKRDAKMNPTLPPGIPGMVHRNGSRFWYRVRLPGQDSKQDYKLIPPGGQFATNDPNVAVELAAEMYRQASLRTTGTVAGDDLRGPMTVGDLVLRYMAFAREYYHDRGGEETSEVETLRYSFKYLTEHSGKLAAANFTALKLKAFRTMLMERKRPDGNGGAEPKMCRTTINKLVQRVQRMFRWAAEEELVPASTGHSIWAVKSLAIGRFKTRESHDVKPVERQYVELTAKYAWPTTRDMMMLQLYTGMRPGEVCEMQVAEINIEGDIWQFKPLEHKTAYRGHTRLIRLGPQAQEIVKRRMAGKGTMDYLFSPRQEAKERKELRAAARKTPVQPSQVERAERNAKRNKIESLRDHFDTTGYRQSINDTIDRANKALLAEAEKNRAEGFTVGAVPVIPHWHPNQIRHTTATIVRKEFGDKGREAAKALLGHKTLKVTDQYAEIDSELADAAARRLG